MKIITPMTVTPASLIYTNIPEDDAPIYDPLSTYAVGNRVISSSIIYYSVADNNLGHDPATSPTKWTPEQSTNRMRPFDDSITSQATIADRMEFVIQTTGTANGVALLNFDATVARVICIDQYDGVVYDTTVNPVSTSGINNFFKWLFWPITRVRDLTLTDLPLYSDMTIRIILDRPGLDVGCGAVVVGAVKSIGQVQNGVSIGYSDYSPKERDKFGHITFKEGDYSRDGGIPLWLQKGEVDDVFAFFIKRRVKPVVIIGNPNLSSAIFYGIVKDLRIVLSYPTYAVCSFNTESLT